MYRAGLLPAQYRLLDALGTLVEESGVPSYAEMAERLGFSSCAPIQQSLKRLERNGFISRIPGQTRAISILKPIHLSLLCGDLDLHQETLTPCEPTPLPTITGCPCLGFRIAHDEPQKGRIKGDILLLRCDHPFDELPQSFLGRSTTGDETFYLQSHKDGPLVFRLAGLWRDLSVD